MPFSSWLPQKTRAVSTSGKSKKGIYVASIILKNDPGEKETVPDKLLACFPVGQNPEIQTEAG